MVWFVPVYASDAVRGRADAAVTIVEFGDLSDPLCRHTNAVLTQMRRRFGAAIRIVWKDRPLAFHDAAEPAFELGRAAFEQAGADGFWRVHDRLLAPEADPVEGDGLGALRNELGLSAPVDREAMRVARRRNELLADSLGVTEAPHLFINGRSLPGARTSDELAREIEQALHASERSGGATSYAALIAGGQRLRGLERVTSTARPVVPPGSVPHTGSRVAPLQADLFVDFSSPFTARAMAVLELVDKRADLELGVRLRHLPQPTPGAALSAEALVDAFAQRQSEGFLDLARLIAGERQPPTAERLEQLAESAQLDGAALAKALALHTHRSVVEADIGLARKWGVDGAPSMRLGDYLIRGVPPIGQLERAYRLARADAQVAAGVPGPHPDTRKVASGDGQPHIPSEVTR